MKTKLKNSNQNIPMKKIALLLTISFITFSCGKKDDQSVEEIIKRGDLSEIKQKKTELGQQQSELTAKIDQLDKAINQLDKNRGLDLVTTQVIQDTLFKHYAEVQGDVATDENIIIYPEFSGVLIDIRIKEGQNVRKGQTLAIIDDGGLSSELAQLETRVALAKTSFERQERLWEQNIGSEMQYLETKTNYEAIQRSLEQLKSRLAKTVITAPFSGVIDEVITDEGQVVNPGQSPLFRLISLENMYVDAAVPENYLNMIEKGTQVKIKIGSINREYEGEVRQVGSYINPNNRTFGVQVALPNEDGLVKPNQIATIRLNDYTAENAVVIPENSVQQNALGENIVYILEKDSDDETGIARKKIVETGYVYQDKIEITEGIQPGEILIVEGAKNLREGQEVKIRNEE
ncbi:MAG: efflux RND transporter periplasmic adaptor subunit [Salegentibacter sp.]|nr:MULTISPECIES: efflux RND transporter periplasmic adaptor subunit [Salegentibacter]MDR9456738.1 efflux RND transporter periplasmic adaptor subunit [Salegentibacter sp.]